MMIPGASDASDVQLLVALLIREAHPVQQGPYPVLKQNTLRLLANQSDRCRSLPMLLPSVIHQETRIAALW